MRTLLGVTLLVGLTACGTQHAGMPCNPGEVSGLTGCTSAGETHTQKFSWESIPVSYDQSTAIGCEFVKTETWSDQITLTLNYRKIVEQDGGNLGVRSISSYQSHDGAKTTDHFTEYLSVYNCPTNRPNLDTIRVTNNPEVVKGCKFISNVHAKGQTSVLIKTLQYETIKAGGNTLSLTVHPTGSEALGEAYACSATP